MRRLCEWLANVRWVENVAMPAIIWALVAWGVAFHYHRAQDARERGPMATARHAS